MFSAATKTGSQPAVAKNYIEDVFSTYLYTGTGATLSINNGIDLSGKGGLTWIKQRDVAGNNLLMNTISGATKRLASNSAAASVTSTAGSDFSSFNSNGFSLGVNQQSDINTSAQTYCSWSFREQAKFFDVVTYTGDGTNRTISHNLGSVPGMIIVKRTDTTGAWQVYHRSLANTEYLVLNTTAAKATGATRWNSTTPTSSVFSLGTDATVNASSGTYVAYLFAHDAGGFGTTGTDNVISCGSFTGTATVNLGYEPQYLLYKPASGETNNWIVADVMRGFNASPTLANPLFPNLTIAEVGPAFAAYVNSTGFTVSGNAGVTYIYMAIRRPMKVPTDATTVFAPTIWSGNTTTQDATRSITGFGKPTDLFIGGDRDNPYNHNYTYDRLRGTDTSGGLILKTQSTGSEAALSYGYGTYSFAQQDGITLGNYNINYTSRIYVGWFFGRAPGFFDVVCYTGQNSSNQRVTHNLTVTPELIIVKSRNQANDWYVYAATEGRSKYGWLNRDWAFSSGVTNFWGTSNPTSTDFGIDSNTTGDGAGITVAAYLFATCPGVSKVGSYTGNGTTQAISCGFTGGARFVLIKRTDDVGDWYVYDTARGMTTLTDPYLLLNSTAAESATLGSVTTTAGGFTVNASILSAINTNAASYIFLAIA